MAVTWDGSRKGLRVRMSSASESGGSANAAVLEVEASRGGRGRGRVERASVREARNAIAARPMKTERRGALELGMG